MFVHAAVLCLALTAQTKETREWPNGSVFRGHEVVVDLPESMRIKNVGSKIDGAGMCVWATSEMAANYQNIRPLFGIMNRLAASEKGGGWPERVEKEAKKAGVDVVQYQGKDPAILDLAMKTGRPCGITLGYSDNPMYGGQTIAHWVLLVHFDKEFAAYIDNNDPNHVVWVSRDEMIKRACHPHGYMWAGVFLPPPPPPVPTN